MRATAVSKFILCRRRAYRRSKAPQARWSEERRVHPTRSERRHRAGDGERLVSRIVEDARRGAVAAALQFQNQIRRRAGFVRQRCLGELLRETAEGIVGIAKALGAHRERAAVVDRVARVAAEAEPVRVLLMATVERAAEASLR